MSIFVILTRTRFNEINFTKFKFLKSENIRKLAKNAVKFSYADDCGRERKFFYNFLRVNSMEFFFEKRPSIF